MADGSHPRPGRNGLQAVPLWDHAGLSRAVADDLTAVFGSGPRQESRNETVLYSHPKTLRSVPKPRGGIGLAVRLAFIAAAGVVGLSVGWVLTHPPGHVAAQTQDAAAPASGLSVQVEGGPNR